MELKQLNEGQIKAVVDTDGPIRIIAGAGTGKTRVITYKIAYLLEKLGIAPNAILAVTFTNKAAKEMKERIAKISLFYTNVPILTFHGFCAWLLRQDIKQLNLNYDSNFNIIDIPDKTSIIKSIIKDSKLKLDKQEVNFITKLISKWKNEQTEENEVLGNNGDDQKRMFFKVYQKYNEHLIKNNLLDFDDLLILTAKLLTINPQVLAKWQAKFSYILVDEFQDTNDLQFQIIKLLVAKHQNLTVVGDPDQTIYSFRGANSNLIINFDRFFKNSKTYILDQNYRSSQEILNLANDLIAYNPIHIKKNLFTNNESGPKPVLFQANSSSSEAMWISNKIKELLETKKVNLHEIAILYRANHLSRELEQALIQNNIDYRIFGGLKFFERKEIKDVLAFIKVLILNDQLSTTRILNLTPNIGMITINKINEQASKYNLLPMVYLYENKLFQKKEVQQLITILLDIKENLNNYKNIADLVSDILEKTGYLKWLEDRFEEDRIENISQLLAQIREIDKNRQEELFNERVISYLQEISLYTSHDEIDEISDKVNLMTVHNAKGLEFSFVFVYGLNEGIFPSHKAYEQEWGIEEERRIFYVAITRAKKELFLSYSKGYSYYLNDELIISSFLEEIDSQHLQKIEKNKSNKLNFTSNKNFSNPFKNKIKSKWSAGDIIEHSTFGRGIITNVLNNTSIEVAFEKGLRVLKSDHPLISKII